MNTSAFWKSAECLKENDIFDKSCQIFNCDETGVSLNPSTVTQMRKAAAKGPGDKAGTDVSHADSPKSML